MNLGFDLDEVIAQTAKMVFDKFNKKYECNYSHEGLTSFYFDENHFSDNEEEQNMIVENLLGILFHDPHLQEIEPYPGAVSTLQKLSRQGHKIYIITKRREVTREDTVAWLLNHKIPYDEVVFTGLDSKEEAARKYRLDCFVDDLEENLVDLYKGKARWRKGLMLMTRPWNEAHYIDKSKFKRVNNWNDISRAIELGNRFKH